MPSYVYGRTVDYRFVPLVENEPVKVDSLVSARIFSTSPSELQISDPSELGYIGSPVTTWESAAGYEKIINFPALVDPNPHGGTEYDQFWVVVNFKYEEGGPTVFALESIFVFKPDALTSRIVVTFADIMGVEPKLKSHFTPADVDRFTVEAKDDVMGELQDRGYDRKSLGNLEKLNDATKFRAVALMCWSLFSDQAPHWKDKAKLRDDQYLKRMKATQPGHDVDGDGVVTPGEKVAKGGVVYQTR